MRCDLCSRAERKTDDGWEIIPDLLPFGSSVNSVFSFLAGVRNYASIRPLSQPRGLPDDAPDGSAQLGKYSHSWLSLDELTAFNYDAPIEDRRFTQQPGSNPAAYWPVRAEPGQGKMTTYREFLGPAFFAELERLKAAGTQRILFGFDQV